MFASEKDQQCDSLPRGGLTKNTVIWALKRKCSKFFVTLQRQKLDIFSFQEQFDHREKW